MKYTLSDEVIAVIARSLQLAMLTGTDVVDHLRLIEVAPAEGENKIGSQVQELKLTVECASRVERNIQDLLARADRLKMEISTDN